MEMLPGGDLQDGGCHQGGKPSPDEHCFSWPQRPSPTVSPAAKGPVHELPLMASTPPALNLVALSVFMTGYPLSLGTFAWNHSWSICPLPDTGSLWVMVPAEAPPAV